MKFLKRGTDFLSSSPAAIVLTLALFAIGVGLPQISAEFYGISIDNTCKTMLKNNLTTVCPTYEDIITLFPDTSTRKITGEFGYYHGLYQRLPTKLINSFGYYQYISDPILFIDPPSEFKTKLHMIEIKANLKEYKLPDNKSYDKVKHTITLGTGRFIDSCRTAYIDAENWIFLVGDTMKHMQSGCTPDSTNYVTLQTTQLNRTKHDITTSYKWRMEQWQKESILICGSKLCLYEKNLPSPP